MVYKTQEALNHVEAEHKRIVIINDGTGPNLGDRAILESMLDCLRRSAPDLKISVLHYTWKMSDLLRTFRILWLADLVVIGGGQVLHDQTSVAFNLMVLSKAALAVMLGKPVMFYGIGAGPLKTRTGRFLTRLIVDRAALITVRDPESKPLLEQLGVTRPPVHVTADSAFTLSPTDSARAGEILAHEGIDSENGPVVVIAPRRWFHYRHTLLPVSYTAGFTSKIVGGVNEFLRVQRIIADAADRAVEELEAQILFVPMRRASSTFDPGQDDDTVSLEIIRQMLHGNNATILSRDYTPGELKSVLGQADLIIGMRLHSLIMGSTMGVPVIGIGITPKFDSFFKMIAQENYLFDVNDVSRDSLVHAIRSALSHREQLQDELEVQCKHLQERANKNTDFLRQLLNQQT